MPEEPRSLFSILSNAAFTFLVAACAVWAGVKLLISVWKVLAILGAIAFVICAIVIWWRRRQW